MATKVRNQTEAKTWAATDKRQEVPVDGARHLFLIVQPSGKKSWAWRARRIGEPGTTKATLGAFETYSIKDAMTWAEGLTKARDAGEDTSKALAAKKAEQDAAAKVKRETEKKTLDWYWTEHHKPRFVDTLKQGREEIRMYEKHIKPAIGSKALSAIDHDDLSAIVKGALKTSPTGANHLVSMMRTMFKRALTHFRAETGLRSNPAEWLAKPHDESRTRKQRVLDTRELGYLISACDRLAGRTGMNATYARAMKLIIHTGTRLSEALNAPWSEFDLESGIWTIPEARAKNGFPHVLPLPLETIEWLKEVRKVSKRTYLFSVDVDAPLKCYSKPLANLVEATERLAERDGMTMERWSAHAIRRTFSTELSSITDNDLNPLVPPHVVEALLNHISGASKAGVAGIYNKYLYKKEKSAALRVWQDHLISVKNQEETRAKVAMVKARQAEAA